jgi:oxygen-independent coproporphyrinogen III oxidase
MAGLYIHIPFCKSICGYCDFYKTTRVAYKDVFLSALIREIELLRPLMLEFPIRTIYFGGGTPSILQRNDFELIFDSLRSVVSFDMLDEITIEVNPDDFTRAWATSLKSLPFNRISFGLQSVYDDLLSVMGRRHTSKQSLDAVYLASELGFENITVDLIYGLPNLDLFRWQNTVDVVSSLPIQHVSAYCLTYEKNTRFYVDLKKGLKMELSDEDNLSQYNVLRNTLSLSGFFDYEISNFSKPGFESKHNSLYWSGEEYFGLGPSAHSFYNGNRYWNVSDFKRYAENLNSGVLCRESEHLSFADLYNELVMLGLRQRKGVELKRLDLFGDDLRSYFVQVSSRLIGDGLLEVVDGWCRIPDSKRFVTDRIIQDLFVVD